MHHRKIYYIVNGITIYRIIAAVFLVYLIFVKDINWFKWLLAVSFFTDMIDGYMARKYNATSIIGSRLDSIGDDLTIAAALVGLILLKTDFIRQERVLLFTLLGMYGVQNIAALIKYRKTTAFHTYSAKAGALFQGIFLILVFFLDKPPMLLFYAGMLVTAINLVEETIMVILLPEWKADVKGLFWMKKNK
jgi:CDP-diacylglycerol--glycerol-3-phosphate 3-phosphatidyltransferase